MKVKELIEELQRFNPDDRICFVNEDARDKKLAVSNIEPYNGTRENVCIVLHER